jgi:hypothetical protein
MMEEGNAKRQNDVYVKLVRLMTITKETPETDMRSLIFQIDRKHN